MILTIYEKLKYIEEDFKQSAVYQNSNNPSPEDLDNDTWWHNVIHDCGAWADKYKGKGEKIYSYAMEIAFDWLESLEKEWRKLRGNTYEV